MKYVKRALVSLGLSFVFSGLALEAGVRVWLVVMLVAAGMFYLALTLSEPPNV